MVYFISQPSARTPLRPTSSGLISILFIGAPSIATLQKSECEASSLDNKIFIAYLIEEWGILIEDDE